MIIFLNIIFYIFGIGLPMLVICVAFFKKSKRKLINIIEKSIIAVIIFAIFYIVRLGGYSILEGDNKVMSNSNNDIKNENKNSEDTNSNNSIEVNKDDEKIEITQINGVTYVNGVLIVNKTYPLPEDYVPIDTYKDANGLRYCTDCIDKEAYQKFQEMDADATSLGLNLWIQSGYRSYELQKDLYNRYVSEDGKVAADTYSARPGHSEHQSGLAFDLNSVTDEFQYTDEGKWVNENAYRYGFIIRYPKGKDDITGYKYESWHLRYVGIELAETLYNNGDWITLEEHFNLTSKYEEIVEE